MSKFLYRSFHHAKLAAQWLCDYINENGGNATCQVYDSLASGQIVNMNCVAAKGDNGEEVIGWTYVRSNQATASE